MTLSVAGSARSITRRSIRTPLWLSMTIEPSFEVRNSDEALMQRQVGGDDCFYKG